MDHLCIGRQIRFGIGPNGRYNSLPEWKIRRGYMLNPIGRSSHSPRPLLEAEMVTVWTKTIRTHLESHSWLKIELKSTQLDAETCLYIYQDSDQMCFLVVYVDDLLLAATSQAFMDKVKEKLCHAFKMRDLAPVSYILGIEIEWDRRKHTISLSQKQYCEMVLK